MSDSHSNPGSDGTVIDMAVIDGLRELGGEDDPGLLTELIEMYLADAPVRIREVQSALATGDIPTLERAAHTLKSSSANLGARTLSSISKEIEELARKKQTSGIAPLVAASVQALGEVETALRALRT